MPTFAALQEQFALPGLVQFEAGTNGLTRAVVTTPHAHAHLYLHGAHLTHYQPAGQPPVLFLSRCSEFAPQRAIRGGVPVIFPWFGPKRDDALAPAHGFARLMEWDVTDVATMSDGSVKLTLGLASSSATQAMWPASWALSYRVTVGATLEMELEVRNTGDEGDAPLRFEEALHTYFAVQDVRQVSVEGLENTEYLDKVDDFKRKRQGTAPLHIEAETDRVYLETRAAYVINDPGLNRRVTIAKTGSEATVVWNPCATKAQAMTDLCDDEWPNLLCLETANVGPHIVALQPGASHRMHVTISTS